MAEVIWLNSQPAGQSRDSVSDRTGICPECGSTDGYMNVGGNHWFVCELHRTRWPAGYNLFSCWRDETEALWQANATKLQGFTEVEPIFFAPDGAVMESASWTLRLVYDPSAPMRFRIADSDECDVRLTSLRRLTPWQVAEMLRPLLEPPATASGRHALPTSADDNVPF